MVDTIKLLIPIDDPGVLSKGAFAPWTAEQLVSAQGTGMTHLNPHSTYAKLGKYMPRLTLHKRLQKDVGVMYQLVVEFSAPKMIYGNNFDELTDSDFEPLLRALQDKLYELIEYRFSKQELAHADVGAWHPSKNIVFRDYTATQTILNTIGKLDVSKVYDVQKTNFRDGHVVHIHCNSIDIAFYDKLADLRKSKVSEKRALEKDSATQLSLLEGLTRLRPLEIFRYEVRFVGKAAIKRASPQLAARTFASLFSERLCQDVLIKHWLKITASVDMLALDIKQPHELLQNYIAENPHATLRATLAAVAGLLVVNEDGASALRNTLGARYGKNAWYRIKPLLKAPGEYRLKSFRHIDNALEEFTPTRMSELKD